MGFLGVPIYGKQCPFYGHKRAFYGKQCPFYGMSTVCLRSIWGKKTINMVQLMRIEKKSTTNCPNVPYKICLFFKKHCRWFVRGLSMVCPWFVYGLSMVCPWFVYGLSMVCPGVVYGLNLGLLELGITIYRYYCTKPD